MRRLGTVSKGTAVTLVAMAVISAFALTYSRAYAARPAPDCGPTREWNCVVPGCPDCPEILFEGTVCEKAAFEKQTGRVCSPA